jgi:four helix bundle protein
VFGVDKAAHRLSLPTVRDHTSLHAWQQARATNIAVIRLAKTSWKPYASALFNQLQRASLSVQLNIAEGYTFGDSPTFTRHLGIAYGSAVETGELLQLALDADVVEEELARTLLKRTRRTERLLLGMLKQRRQFTS